MILDKTVIREIHNSATYRSKLKKADLLRRKREKSLFDSERTRWQL